jgi:hypothetical protein
VLAGDRGFTVVDVAQLVTGIALLTYGVDVLSWQGRGEGVEDLLVPRVGVAAVALARQG